MGYRIRSHDVGVGKGLVRFQVKPGDDSGRQRATLEQRKLGFVVVILASQFERLKLSDSRNPGGLRLDFYRGGCGVQSCSRQRKISSRGKHHKKDRQNDIAAPYE